MKTKIDYKNIARQARRDILEMIYNSKSSHIGSALSCADILTVLYFGILKPKDIFILSKAHAVAALYAALAQKGFFSKENLKNYYQNGSNLPGHATKDTVPGVAVSAGSLGHGSPMAVGMALAGKIDKKDHKIFVVLSDGECEEGSNWEAALFASHHKLDNLTVIIDCNKWQALGRTKEVLNTSPLKNKWASFGWQVKEVNGHNYSEMEKVFKKAPFRKGRPSLIIANTIKGKGFSFMENKLEWHYRSPNDEEYKLAIKELK